MNKQIKTWTASLLAISIIGTAGIVMAEERSLGAKAASQDTSYTLIEMLNYAIEDEYLAKAEYAAIIDDFDVTRPFTNIIRAENNHIAELLPLFEAYRVPVPAESSVAGQAMIPASLAEAFAIGVEAEEKNIAMYEAFLKQDLPDDVRDVFENLRDGSIKHLAAFERGVSRDGSTAGAGNRTDGATNGNGKRGARGNGQSVKGQISANDNNNGLRVFQGNRGNSIDRGSRGTDLGIQDPENCILG